MNERKVPFKRMMFVCTNTRDGEAACGNADRGENCGGNLVEHLREEVQKRGLKGRIRIAKSGCMDLCGRGPILMVFDEEGAYTTHTQVSLSDVSALADKYIEPLKNS